VKNRLVFDFKNSEPYFVTFFELCLIFSGPNDLYFFDYNFHLAFSKYKILFFALGF